MIRSFAVAADALTSRVDPSKVRFASPSKVLAVPDPVITRLSALLFIVVDVASAQVRPPVFPLCFCRYCPLVPVLLI